jgi:nitrous oxidase accessory protein NosD
MKTTYFAFALSLLVVSSVFIFPLQLASAQSDNLTITGISGLNSSLVGSKIQIQISVNYGFTGSKIISLMVVGPEDSVFYNDNYKNIEYMGSGSKTFQFNLPVCSPGYFEYSVTAWYYGNSQWTKADRSQIGITGYWSSKTWQVPQDYPNINDAVIAASPGDNIAVAPGNYSGFVVDKSVRIQGAGLDQTVINSGVTLASPSCSIIQSFRIEGFYGSLYLNCNNSLASNCNFYCDANINGNANTIANCAVYGKVTVNGDYNTVVRSSIYSDMYHHGIEILNKNNRIISNNVIDSCIIKTSSSGSPPYIDYYAIITQYATGTVIRNNTIMSPFGIGIKLAEHCEFVSIIGNRISDSDTGIHVGSFTVNVTTIDFNTIQNCSTGSKIVGGYNIEAYGNNFVSNQLNAYDNSYYPIWYKNNKGNYWSDWVSPDSNNDGVVDKPYIISGYSRSSDQYPLVTMTVWTPTADQTQTPVTSPTLAPTSIRTLTPTPTKVLVPSPSVPEYYIWAILPILLAVSLIITILKQKLARAKSQKLVSLSAGKI